MTEDIDKQLDAFMGRGAADPERAERKHRPANEPKGPLVFKLQPLPPAIKLNAEMPEQLSLKQVEMAFIGWAVNQDFLLAVAESGGLRDIVFQYYGKADFDRLTSNAELVAKKIRKLHKMIRAEMNNRRKHH